MKKVVIKKLVDLAKKNLGKSQNEMTGLTELCDKHELINCMEAPDGTYVFIFGEKVYKVNNGQTELPQDEELVDTKYDALVVFDPHTGISFRFHLLNNLVVSFSCANATEEFCNIWKQMLEHILQEA